MPRNVLIPTTDLLVDRENPRLVEEQASQRDAIHAIAEEQGDDLVRLAKDIVKHGLSPLEKVMVLEAQGGGYHVLEGNRRIVALKALENPDLVQGALPANTFKQLQALSRQYKSDPVELVECTIVSSRDEGLHWIRLRHTGRNAGVGVSDWDAKATARFNERFGRLRPTLRILEFLQDSEYLGDDVKGLIKRLPYTNLERLINDPYVRGKLGIEIERGTGVVLTVNSDEEVARALEQIVRDLVEGEVKSDGTREKITVTSLKRKGDRKAYIDRLESVLPDSASVAKDAHKLGEGSPQDQKVGPRKTQANLKRKVLPPSGARRQLIPSDCRLTINVSRVNDIYHELKRLDVNLNKNACAVLLRAFVEMSIDEFAERNKIDRDNKWDHRTSLATKVSHVAAFLKANNLLKESQLRPINRAASDQNVFNSTTTLNGFVHNRHFSPGPNDLKAMWDSLQIFIDKLWP